MRDIFFGTVDEALHDALNGPDPRTIRQIDGHIDLGRRIAVIAVPSAAQVAANDLPRVGAEGEEASSQTLAQ
jgi:hypothetical protein